MNYVCSVTKQTEHTEYKLTLHMWTAGTWKGV